tara:strand:+ start:357 stop:668 length:312 start_codon:yes stop_codon:yes gene_type:complete
MGVTVGSTNVGLFSTGSAVGEATVVQETSNISLKGLSTGGEGMTFAADGGPGDTFEKIGGTNSAFQSTQQDITASQVASIEQAPFKMSELIGGEHVAGGGPGR